MAGQANFHPIFLNESWHGPSFTYLLAPPVVGLPLRPPPAPCCAVEKCFQNMPPILTWLIEGHDGPTHDLRWSRSIDDAWAVSANFIFILIGAFYVPQLFDRSTLREKWIYIPILQY